MSATVGNLFGNYDDDDYNNPTFPPPRPFQEVAIQELRAAAATKKNQIFMAPTGSGKTYCAMKLVHECLSKGKRAIFVCDRLTLIEQTSAVADSYGLKKHSVYQSKHLRHDERMRFQIASAQTIASRLKMGKPWPDADLIIIDECHTQLKVWTEHVPTCRARVIGLSATPFSDGLGILFTNLVNATTMHELTKTGVLVPMRVFTCTPIDMTGVLSAKSKKEWSDEEVEKRGLTIVGDVVKEYLKFGEDRKAICFASSILHCEELCKAFNAAGIMAALYTSRTKKDERESLLYEYRKPDSALRVLISVEALAKGFDVPDVGCVIDCRPLRKSLSTAMQMWGRGLRSSPDTSKADCLLLDHSGNIIRFREDFEDIFFNGLKELSTAEKLDAKIRDDEEMGEPKPCPSCGQVPFFSRCIACGYQSPRRALVEHKVGEMRELDLSDRLKNVQHRQNVWAEIVAITLTKPRAKPLGFARHCFMDQFGVWPPKNWGLDVPYREPSLAVRNKIKAKQIAYALGMKKYGR